MQKTMNRWWIAVGCLFVGALGGVAGAQVVQSVFDESYLNTGLFSLADGDTAHFNVSLDDDRPGQPAHVRLQFFNETGNLLASEDAVLGAGQSTTLRLTRTGFARAHAKVVDAPLQLKGRRAIVGMVETFDRVGARLPTSCTIHVPSSSGDGGRQ